MIDGCGGMPRSHAELRACRNLSGLRTAPKLDNVDESMVQLIDVLHDRALIEHDIISSVDQHRLDENAGFEPNYRIRSRIFYSVLDRYLTRTILHLTAPNSKASSPTPLAVTGSF